MSDNGHDGHHGFSISCDECSMQCSWACTDCVVTFVLREQPGADGEHPSLELDDDEARVVQLFGRAGLVPRLKFEAAG